MSNRLSKQYWDNKFQKAPIIYSGRSLRGKTERIGIDVKTMVPMNDAILENTIKRYRLDKGNQDKTAHAIQRFVVDSFTYKYDKESSNVPEYWQFPFESLQSGIGDCEDGAILTASLMINAGIPSWRVKVAAGYVQAEPTAPEGGHAYCIYLASDGEWRILDWCYYEDSHLDILEKPLAKKGGQHNAYKDIWFTFNNEYSWNQTAIEIKNGRISEHQTKSLDESVDPSEVTLESIMKNIDARLEVSHGH